jgi:hypothetical protein
LADVKPTAHDKDKEVRETTMNAYGKISALHMIR